MLALVVEFRIKPAHIAAFEQEILANACASRETEPGCRQFDVCRDPADPGVFLLYELYDDDLAFEAHLRTAHYGHMDAVSTQWVDSKTVKRYVLAAQPPISRTATRGSRTP
jgi:quinol monooxygenase YgiN